MSSNFYASTHAKYWLLTRQESAKARETDSKYATPHQSFCSNIFFASSIQKVGKRLMSRQIPIATATVYFRRFYTKNAYCETNPYLVLAACIFVAAKVEETPVHIKSVVAEAKVVFAEHHIKMFPAEPHKSGEMEFYMIEDIDFHSVVFHPYRASLNITGREPADAGYHPKTRLQEDADIRKEQDARESEARRAAGPAAAKAPKGLGGEDDERARDAERVRRSMGRGSGEGLMEIDEGTSQIAWFIINDSYRTDVPSSYPPYVIALAALYIAFTLTTMSGNQARTRSSSQSQTLALSLENNSSLGSPPPPGGPAEFSASFEVSLPVLMACVQDIIVSYPIWEAFEPSPTRPGSNAAPAPQPPEGKFGPDDAEALVRRMIEEHMVDVGHPEDGGRSDKKR